MSARVIHMAERRAQRERAPMRELMRGDYHRPQKRPTLAEIMDAGPWAGRWS